MHVRTGNGSGSLDESGIAFIWRPYDAVLGRVDGVKGYHDVSRHPEARCIPGLVLFRWDAPLFFANAAVFEEHVLQASLLREIEESSIIKKEVGRVRINEKGSSGVLGRFFWLD